MGNVSYGHREKYLPGTCRLGYHCTLRTRGCAKGPHLHQKSPMLADSKTRMEAVVRPAPKSPSSGTLPDLWTGTASWSCSNLKTATQRWSSGTRLRTCSGSAWSARWVPSCIGPPVDPGFYYDAYVGDNGLTPADLKTFEARCKKVAKKKEKFERIVLSKDEALELFADNPFKVEIIKNKIKDGSSTTAYRNGTLIDLCMGPHIPHTGKVKAIKMTKHSASYWLGDADNDSLQRAYGISFPDKKKMKE